MRWEPYERAPRALPRESAARLTELRKKGVLPDRRGQRGRRLPPRGRARGRGPHRGRTPGCSLGPESQLRWLAGRPPAAPQPPGMLGAFGAEGAEGCDGVDGVDGVFGVEGVDGVSGAAVGAPSALPPWVFFSAPTVTIVGAL